MKTSPRKTQRRWGRLLAGFAAPALMWVSGVAAQDPPAAEPLPIAPAVKDQAKPAPAKLDLASAREQALEKQPALKAYRASVEAARLKVCALEKLRLASLIRRDLPTRRRQAELGLLAAEAQLSKAEWETVYSTTRTYLTALYARQQLQLAETALSKTGRFQLPYLRDLADRIREEETRRDVKKWDVDAIDILINVTRGRSEEPRQGILRALAALREAIGLDASESIALVQGAELPTLRTKVDRGAIVSMALERRGEITQSRVGAQVTALEVEAQGMVRGPSVDTFASGSDIHALAIPQGIANGEYRPGGVSIEMPGTLNGSRKSRMEQASALHARAQAVVDKTRQLITLEAEDAYFKWAEAQKEAEEYRKAAEQAEKTADLIATEFKASGAGLPTLNDLLEARVRATQLKLQSNKAQFDLLLALAALERITAGGFSPGFVPAPSTADKSAPPTAGSTNQ